MERKDVIEHELNLCGNFCMVASDEPSAAEGLKQLLQKTEQHLGEIIDEWGIDYLQRKPYEVYKKFISLGTDRKLAGLVLVTLLSDASKKQGKWIWIWRTCRKTFRKNAA